MFNFNRQASGTGAASSPQEEIEEVAPPISCCMRSMRSIISLRSIIFIRTRGMRNIRSHRSIRGI